jgi:hypothetical protein
MATNGKGKNQGDTPDIEANERTGLLESASSDTRSQDTDEESDRLWNEMDRPWPATFERSISLLASPIINVMAVDAYTRSPKPGNTPLANRRRMMRYGLETPEGTILPPLIRHKSIDGKYKGGDQKVDSIDFKTTKDNLRAQAKLTQLSDTQKDQERKAKEAAEYRANILKEKRGEGVPQDRDSVEMSPAYGREKASLARAKQEKAEAKEREASMDGKATFLQCIFNLANILMVSLLSNPPPLSFVSKGHLLLANANYSLMRLLGGRVTWPSIRMRAGWHGGRHIRTFQLFVYHLEDFSHDWKRAQWRPPTSIILC